MVQTKRPRGFVEPIMSLFSAQNVIVEDGTFQRKALPMQNNQERVVIIGNDTQQKEIYNALKERDENACRVMKARHTGMVSKEALLSKVVQQDHIISYLYEELFYSDANHKVFQGMPRDFIADLVSRVCDRRMGQAFVFRGGKLGK
jgi:hypothetical protein